MMAPPGRSLTFYYTDLAHQLVTEVTVSPCDPLVAGETPPCRQYKAIWDTGCNNSGITRRVAEELGLKPIRVVRAYTGSGVEEERPTYSVDFAIGDDISTAELTGVDAVEVELPPASGADVLIGMNVILKGDFAVTNRDRRTVLSVRFPSCEHIDFRCCEKGEGKGSSRRGGG